VKLLLDENLSFRLIPFLLPHFPESVHVRDIGMSHSNDAAIWDYARSNGYVIVSKDSDFHQLAFLKGAPPNVVWIQRGNCPTDLIADLLINNRPAIQTLIDQEQGSFLALQ
jgi:predicted nuclease of predicted toxin-antitoxin system